MRPVSNHNHQGNKKSSVHEEEGIFIRHLECTLCHRTYKKGDFLTCPVCGETGILEVVYDYEHIRHVFSKSHLKASQKEGIWRYGPLLPTRQVHRGLHVGDTPLYLCRRLAEALDLPKLYVKDEGLNPSGSLKDRASIIAATMAIKEHKHVVACSSTGNAATSLAASAAKFGLSSVIFVPERAPLGKLSQVLIYGASVIKVAGDYGATYQLSKAAIDYFGWYNRNAAVNPYLVEGKKTVALEVAEQLRFEVPDWVVVSVGDGCTIAGVYKGFYDLLAIGFIDRMPRILGVQASGCAPIYEAYLKGEPIKPAQENTMADSIAVGSPRNPVKALAAIEHSHGAMVTVSDQAIYQAMSLLGRTEGIYGEPAGVASLAGTIKALSEGILQRTDQVVILMTGNGLKDPRAGQEAAPSPINCQPNFDDFLEKIEGLIDG